MYDSVATSGTRGNMYYSFLASVLAVIVLPSSTIAAVLKNTALPPLVERAAAAYTLPQNASQPAARTAALVVTQLGFTYGTAVAGGPYFPSGVLGTARAAADGVDIQLEVVPEVGLSTKDAAAATADGLLDKVRRRPGERWHRLTRD